MTGHRVCRDRRTQRESIRRGTPHERCSTPATKRVSVAVQPDTVNEDSPSIECSEPFENKNLISAASIGSLAQMNDERSAGRCRGERPPRIVLKVQRAGPT